MARFNEVLFKLQTNDSIGFTTAQQIAVELAVYISISFEGNQIYENLRYPRFKNFYGYAQLMSGAFVAKEVPLNFLNQLLWHYRNTEIEGFQNVGCQLKAIANGLPTPINPVIFTVPSRSVINGLRIKLTDGVQANLILKWEELQPACGDIITEPDEQQGKPPNPANNQGNPPPRPSNQGGIPGDLSGNDGIPSLPGQPVPPAPNPAPTGTWKVRVRGVNGACVEFISTYDTDIANFETEPTADTREMGTGSSCGEIDKRLFVNNSPTVATGGGLTVIDVLYN